MGHCAVFATPSAASSLAADDPTGLVTVADPAGPVAHYGAGVWCAATGQRTRVGC